MRAESDCGFHRGFRICEEKCSLRGFHCRIAVVIALTLTIKVNERNRLVSTAENMTLLEKLLQGADLIWESSGEGKGGR